MSAVPSSRPLSSWLIGLGLLVLSAAAGLAVIEARLNLNLSVALVGEPLPPVELAPPPAHRVLLVLVDGLGGEVARTLPTFQRLAREGASASLVSALPSYSSPQYVSLLTGVPPRSSGIRTNDRLRRVALDSVPARLVAQGRTAVVVGDEVDWWAQLFGSAFAQVEVVPPPAVVERARALFPQGDLVLVHLCGVDAAGHVFGAASRQYAAATQEADTTLAALLDAWGYPASPVLVMSDHGHIAEGGHGGADPEVLDTELLLAGPGVLPGARASAPLEMVDVAPTLAALLGVPPPAQAQGRTATELLDLPRAQLAQWERADAQRREEARVRADAVFQARLEAERPAQALRALLVAAVLLAWLLAARGVHEAWRGPVAGLSTLLLVVVLFISLGRHLSYSGWAGSTVRVVGVTAVCTAVALWQLGRFSPVLGGRRVVLASGMVLSFSVPAAALFVVVGAFAPRVHCEPDALNVAPLFAYAALCVNAAMASAWLLAEALASRRRAGS